MVNAEADINSINNANESALGWAAKLGLAKSVELLVNAGADINFIESESGNSILMLCAASGYKKNTYQTILHILISLHT